MLKFLRAAAPILFALSFAALPAAAEDVPNVKAVQALYAAVDKGDIAAVVAGVSDDVRWEVVGRRSDCPCMGVRNGKAGVAEFFSIVVATYDFNEFTPKNFYGVGDKVFVLGHYAETNKLTKKGFDSDFVHVFTFRDGKISMFQEYLDTAKEAEAARS